MKTPEAIKTPEAKDNKTGPNSQTEDQASSGNGQIDQGLYSDFNRHHPVDPLDIAERAVDEFMNEQELDAGDPGTKLDDGGQEEKPGPRDNAQTRD